MSSRHTWKLFSESVKVRKAMLADIKKATTSIDLEQFIFMLDDTGRDFLEAIIERAKEGVAVRMLIDVGGSPDLYASLLDDALAKVGIQIVFFNPISLWRLHTIASWYFRDHRKNLIIDKRVGYTGGTGVYPMDWRDTNVRIEGPVVAQMIYSFDRMWDFAQTGKFKKFKNLSNPEQEFSYITNSPRFKQRHFYKELIRQLRSAHTRAWFATPYFVPDLRFLRLLTRKAREGVDVRLVVPESSDYALEDWAGRSYYTLLLRSGVRLYQYPSFIHAKNYIIDDWASVGSFNLHNISFLLAHEANLFTTSKKFRAELEKQFLDDFNTAREMGQLEWYARPVSQKIKEILTWPIHKFL